MKSTILITGAAGYIGSLVAALLSREGYPTILFDRIRNPTLQGEQITWIEGDLAQFSAIDAACAFSHIDAVMHFAAYIDVGESVADPGKYYVNNVANSLNLFEAMRRHQITRCIFSSSAAIFGEPKQLPISEDHPCHPINPYGESKLMVEKVLRDYDQAYGWKSSCLRYFNAAGADPEDKVRVVKQKESNLIPLALTCVQKGLPLTVFGTDYPTPDGSCIRDYVHVQDIATAHLLALERLKEGRSRNYNLGNGKGYSVWEVIRAIQKVTGRTLKVVKGSRRFGDAPVLLADATRARSELHWQPRYSDLETMIAHAIRPLA